MLDVALDGKKKMSVESRRMKLLPVSCDKSFLVQEEKQWHLRYVEGWSELCVGVQSLTSQNLIGSRCSRFHSQFVPLAYITNCDFPWIRQCCCSVLVSIWKCKPTFWACCPVGAITMITMVVTIRHLVSWKRTGSGNRLTDLENSFLRQMNDPTYFTLSLEMSPVITVLLQFQ